MAKRVMVQIRDCGQAMGYIRVSTDEQHLGPEAQREAIERWAEARDVTVVAWHTDKGMPDLLSPDRAKIQGDSRSGAGRFELASKQSERMADGLGNGAPSA